MCVKHMQHLNLFETSMWNICNIRMKHPEHWKFKLTTCTKSEGKKRSIAREKITSHWGSFLALARAASELPRSAAGSSGLRRWGPSPLTIGSDSYPDAPWRALPPSGTRRGRGGGGKRHMSGGGSVHSGRESHGVRLQADQKDSFF
jgi:hypothetical protein